MFQTTHLLEVTIISITTYNTTYNQQMMTIILGTKIILI